MSPPTKNPPVYIQKSQDLVRTMLHRWFRLSDLILNLDIFYYFGSFSSFFGCIHVWEIIRDKLVSNLIFLWRFYTPTHFHLIGPPPLAGLTLLGMWSGQG